MSTISPSELMSKFFVCRILTRLAVTVPVPVLLLPVLGALVADTAAPSSILDIPTSVVNHTTATAIIKIKVRTFV